jgi:hypothetical protein
MKPLNEKETKNVKFLNEKVKNYCCVTLTENILNKFILDATIPIRAFLKKNGIHDYEQQQNGQDFKVLVKTRILTFSRTIDSETSLYRAGARGDERMWFGSAILEVTKPDDVYALFPRDKELYLINISRIDIEDTWKSSAPTPIGDFISYQISNLENKIPLNSSSLNESIVDDEIVSTASQQPFIEVYSTNFQPDESVSRIDSIRMTDLKEGEVHKFVVRGVCRNSKDQIMYELSLPNEPYNNIYRVFPLRCQDHIKYPKEVICYVKEVTANGRVKLIQDEYAFLSALYLPNQIYSFIVEKEVDNALNNKNTYVVRSEYNLTHTMVTDLEDECTVGEKILCIVSLRRGLHHNVVVYIHKNDEELCFFSPYDVFEGCNHVEDYEKYFINLENYRTRSSKLNDIIDSMNQKIQNYNRLWIFDYTNALFQLSITSSREDLNEIEIINNLIRDIEIWMLEESGLLTKFSPEKREETRLKSERVIEQTEAITRAIQIIRENRQVAYLEDVLAKLRRSSYLRNRKQEFDILYSLISLQQGFLKENMAAFSELIDFTSREFSDSYILERIVNIMLSIIRGEKKRINNELHFLRQSDIDNNIFSDLIIGIGTLLNFHSKNRDEDVELDIKAYSLYQDLCKYLSLIANNEDAILLINKAIEVSALHIDSFDIKSKYLRDFQHNPQSLIDFVKSMKFDDSNEILTSCANEVCAIYKEKEIFVTHIPQGVLINKQITSNVVYSIPGTSIYVTSLNPTPKWQEDQPISYYKKQWKNLLSGIIEKDDSSTFKQTLSQIPVITHYINKDYPNLIFCSGETAMQNVSGAISFQGYLPGVWLGCEMTELFEKGLHLLAEPIPNGQGKINFSITANIRTYSNYMASQTDSVVHGVFLSYLKGEAKAVFITENGVICEADTTEHNQYRLNWTYELVVSSDIDEAKFPKAEVIKEANKRLDKKILLSEQLKSVHEFNINTGLIDVDYTRNNPLPYLHLLIDNYVRLFQDKVALYNIYHTARLFAILEQSTLTDYYSSCIQYIEMVDGFSSAGTQESSIPDFNWDDQLLSMFPTLQTHTEMYNLLKNFGSENDMEYLFRLSMRPQEDGIITKLARISLATSLIENLVEDEQLIGMLRGLVAKTLGNTVENAEPILTDVPVECEADVLDSEYNYGSENQNTEFKTSIVYPAGSESNLPNLEEQMNVIMRTINGFLNAKGGTIYIGVKNDGTPKGIENDLDTLTCDRDKYERIIRDRIVREYNKDVNGTIEITFIGEKTCTVCKVYVPAYVNPIAYRGEFFQRQGNEVRILKGNDLIMFIRRRIEGKEVILENSTVQPLPENLILPAEQPVDAAIISAESTMTSSINPQVENNQSFDLYFYQDGSCQLGHYLPEENAVACIPIDPSMKTKYVIQCYNNGCVNKMPVRNLYNMQFDYRYKNALYKDAVLQKVIILSNEDFILLKSRQLNNYYVKLYPIWDISAHASLGLKGNQLISQNYDEVEGWYPVHKEEVNNCSKLITTTRSNLGAKINSSAIRNEVIWLNENILKSNKL